MRRRTNKVNICVKLGCYQTTDKPIPKNPINGLDWSVDSRGHARCPEHSETRSMATLEVVFAEFEVRKQLELPIDELE